MAASLRGSTAETGAAKDAPNEKVCVFSVLFGGFDVLKAPPQRLIDASSSSTLSSSVVDFIVLTDTPNAGHPAPWQEYVVTHLPYDDPRQNARSFKMLPPDELWDRCDVGIHVDANIDFLRSPLELAAELQPRANLGLVRHPFLQSYQSEIDHLCQIYPHDCALYEQTSKKQQQQLPGFDPRRAPQYETSVFLRRHNDRTKGIMRTWRDELFRSGHLRDQVVLVPVLHRTNAHLELYGPPGGQSLLLPPPANGKSDDPALYTKPMQHGTAGVEPSFVQVYRGHNHDFAKWRCHGKVMGRERSEMAHSIYCGIYYISKRYTPWLEALNPILHNTIKTMDLKNPIKAVTLLLLFALLALAVFFPQSSIMLRLRMQWGNRTASLYSHYRTTTTRYEKMGRHCASALVVALRLSMMVGIGFFVVVSYFYTFAMGVACLWAGIVVFGPPFLFLALCRMWYLHAAVQKTQWNEYLA